MSRRAKQDPLDAAIEAAWYRLGHGVQVSIMDIPAIFRDVRAYATEFGADECRIDAGVRLAIQRYGKNLGAVNAPVMGCDEQVGR